MITDKEVRDAACKFFSDLWGAWVALEEDGAEIDALVLEEITAKHGIIVADGEDMVLTELGEAILAAAKTVEKEIDHA